MARLFFDTNTTLAGAATFIGGTAGNGGVAGTGDGDGRARDSTAYAENGRFGAQANSDQAGTLYIDGSRDLTTWRQCGSIAVVAGTPADIDVPIRFRYYRVRYVNGATPTGAGNFEINSSFRSAQ